jgi:Uncharacterized Fe-S protein
MKHRDIIAAALQGSGFEHFGFLSGERLDRALAGLGPEERSRYGLGSLRSVAAVALPYGEGPVDPPAWALAWECEHPGPRAAVARFARSNWYAELTARLGEASKVARAELVAAGLEAGRPGEWRRLANSCLPEKRIALASGLGRLGRNGLVMVEGQGSAVVLGLLLMPIVLEEVEAAAVPVTEPLSPACAACGRCVAACPTRALGGEPEPGRLVGFRRELCLQHWSSIPGDLPPKVAAAWHAFGGRLYGCDLCQEACPYFRPDPSTASAIGQIGPGLPASWLRASSDEEIRARLKGTALGMAWISPEALRRNAVNLTLAAELPTISENGGRNGKH